MNDLEIALCKSVVQAFNQYEAFTGWWLTHAPEHYLQNAIFSHMSRDYELYLEATYKKIVAGEGRPRRGRPPKDQGKRYDLIVWNKTSNTMRAVIEVKRSLFFSSALKRDADRVRGEPNTKAGYVIIYSEGRIRGGEEKIRAKFLDWEDTLGLRWLNRDQKSLGNDGEWIAAFALFRA